MKNVLFAAATPLDHCILCYCATLPTNHGNGWEQKDAKVGGMLLGVGSSICALTMGKSMESHATGEAVVADHTSIALPGRS